MQSTFVMFAGYNGWANKRVYEAVGMLADADYRADRGAFFRSVHGTLNHLLAADRMWMRRFTGSGDAPDRLDAIVAEDFPGLRRLREAEDSRIADYCHGLSDERLAGVLRYTRVSFNQLVELPLSAALSHFFNHQTHHRGQVHALLTGLTGSGPELDLAAFLLATGVGRHLAG